MKTETLIRSDPEQWKDAAVEALESMIREAAARRGVCFLALSGGKTPQPVYELLAAPPYSKDVPWDRVHVFWGDERMVAKDHPESNFRMAWEAFLSKVPIPPQNVHPVPVEEADAENAARAYAEELRSVFAAHGAGKLGADDFPAFDLILLGMGPDGHTASLFPGSPTLEESRLRVTAEPNPGLPPEIPRITFTLPLIRAARTVVFLVSEEGKSVVLQEVLNRPDQAARKYPAARVAARERLLWIVRGTLRS